MEVATAAPVSDLESKIDALSDQVAFLTEEAGAQRRRRESMTELQTDLMPIATTVVERVADELDDVDWDPADALRLAKRVAENTATLEHALAEMQALAELYAEAKPIIDRMIELGIDGLGQLDERGYFRFMEAGLGVVDRIVTGFTEEDVEQLGDNVVLILQTVKEMTQPEIMAVLYRMIEAIHRQQATLAAEPDEPPGFWSLFRTMREPEVRRGMGRALNTLRAVSDVDTGPPRRFVAAAENEAPPEHTVEEQPTTRKTSEGGSE